MTDHDTKQDAAERAWQEIPYQIRLALHQWAREQMHKYQREYEEARYLNDAYDPAHCGIFNLTSNRGFADAIRLDVQKRQQIASTMGGGYLMLTAFLDKFSGSLLEEVE